MNLRTVIKCRQNFNDDTNELQNDRVREFGSHGFPLPQEEMDAECRSWFPVYERQEK